MQPTVIQTYIEPSSKPCNIHSRIFKTTTFNTANGYIVHSAIETAFPSVCLSVCLSVCNALELWVNTGLFAEFIYTSSTQPSTLCGTVKWVSAFRLMIINGDDGCRLWQPVQADSQSKSSGLVLGWRPVGCQYSLNEPGELLKWLCHDAHHKQCVWIIIIIIIITPLVRPQIWPSCEKTTWKYFATILPKGCYHTLTQ